jgi:hypothetical protein
MATTLPLDVHLIDGTYELFRHYYALPSARDQDGREVAAVRGVLASVLGMIRGGATHLAVATDHVIESFRNGLWPGYKTGEGIEPDLLAQFELLEETLSSAASSSGPWWSSRRTTRWQPRRQCGSDPRVERVIICTPDKDLAQCVRGTRVVQLNRRTRVTLDEAGIVRSSASRRRRFPITWRWSATRQTATPACQAGERNRRLPFSPNSSTSNPFPADWREWRRERSQRECPRTHALQRARPRMLFRTLATLTDRHRAVRRRGRTAMARPCARL